MLLIISRCASVFLRNTLKPSVLSLTECHSFQTPFPLARQPTRSRNMETDMTSPRISDRTRAVLGKLPDEKRTRAEAIIAQTQTPEARASDAADRAILDREYRET